MEFRLDRDHGFRADSASVARRSRDYLARRAQSRGSLRELRAPDGGVGTTSLRGNNDAGPLSVNRGQANLERSASGRHSQLTTWPRSSVEFPEQLTGPRASPSVSQPYHAFPAPDGSRGSPKEHRPGRLRIREDHAGVCRTPEDTASTRFGTVRPRVQIPGPRPFSYSKSAIRDVVWRRRSTAISQFPAELTQTERCRLTDVRPLRTRSQAIGRRPEA